MDVSIVIPAYNVERWLERSVRSAQATQGVSFEIIVVDDGSMDGTLALARRLAAADPSIRLVALGRNRGLSAARNAGIAASRGTWVAHLDADDWFAPERLERLIAAGRSHDADLVADDVYLVDDGNPVPWARMFDLHGWTESEPVLVSAESFATKEWVVQPIFRRAFLEENGISHDMTVLYGEDYLVEMESLCKGGRFLIVPEPYYYYVIGREGSIQQQQRGLSDMVAAVAKARQIAVDAGRPEAVRALDERARTLDRGIAYSVLARTVRARDLRGVLRLVATTPRAYWGPHFTRMLGSVKLRARRVVGWDAR